MYQWLVVIHLAGLVLFAFGHGVSMFVAFRLRSCRDRGLAWELLELSQRGNRFAYLGLLLLIVGGLGAAAQGSLLGTTWVIATSVVLIVVLVAMFALAAGFYYPLRRRMADDPDGGAGLDGDELVAALDNRRPEILAAVGLGGLLVMIALMVLKPA